MKKGTPQWHKILYKKRHNITCVYKNAKKNNKIKIEYTIQYYVVTNNDCIPNTHGCVKVKIPKRCNQVQHITNLDSIFNYNYLNSI